MLPKPKRPIPLLVCGAMLEAASRLIPSPQRLEWKQEWQSEIWHRWQFLAHAGLWNGRESALLLGRCCGVFPDAFWHFTSQYGVQSRLRSWIRSPWACLASMGAMLLIVAALTSGFTATRGIFRAGFSQLNHRLVFIWFHPVSGGGDEGLPPDAVAAWRTRSRLLAGVAPFTIGHPALYRADGRRMQPLVIKTQTGLFGVLQAKPLLGQFPANRGLVLTHSLWKSMFRGDARAIGSKVRIGRDWYQVAAVLQPDFHFLSRQPGVYLVEPFLPDAQLMVVGRLKPGVSERELDKDLTRIAETACYYFFRSQLRYSFLNEAAWVPVRVFLVAALCSSLLVLLASRVPLRHIRFLLKSPDKAAILKRASFFTAKTALACLVVFVATLEWSRSQSAILFGSRDPAAGPFLLWLYILGTMGVFFWSVADQRARCRVCLKLLCFPVRVGCPGCLLLNWSGTELFCLDGHGLMHVPDMAPSWDEESERWISLDESWKGLFAETK